MAQIGRKTPLVRMIAARTKISPVDIVDILRVLPLCMAEAFLQANPEEKEVVNLAAVTASWSRPTKWGPSVSLKAHKRFKIHLTKLRYEKKYPLAERLYHMMNPKTKERVLAKAARGGYNNNSV